MQSTSGLSMEIRNTNPHPNPSPQLPGRISGAQQGSRVGGFATCAVERRPLFPLNDIRYTAHMSIASDLPVHTEHPSGGSTVTFAYDGRACHFGKLSAGSERGPKVASRRGNRVKKDEDGVVTHYPGRHYESTVGSGSTKYYYADGQLVTFERSAGYDPEPYGMRYVLRDHLGSTSIVVNGRGVKLWEDRYYPFGDVRYTYRKDDGPAFPVQTQYRYTSQWFEDGLGGCAENL